MLPVTVLLKFFCTLTLIFDITFGFQMSDNIKDNKANVANPNNPAGGIGNRPAAYQGSKDKSNLDNHGQQKNPNNPKYEGNKQ